MGRENTILTNLKTFTSRGYNRPVFPLGEKQPHYTTLPLQNGKKSSLLTRFQGYLNVVFCPQVKKDLFLLVVVARDVPKVDSIITKKVESCSLKGLI